MKKKKKKMGRPKIPKNRQCHKFYISVSPEVGKLARAWPEGPSDFFEHFAERGFSLPLTDSERFDSGLPCIATRQVE